MALRFATTHWLSRKFPDEYVRSIRNQFKRFDYDVTVLGNGNDYDAPLGAGLQGWLAKLEWFAPWNAPLRPAVVVDLDTYIIHDPARFLDIDGSKLWMIREFLGRPERRRAESGIFVAPSDDDLCARIWQRAQGYSGPDGHLMREFPHSFLPDVVDGIQSYKAHQLQESPGDARIVCFHGKPKPDETKGWARGWWLNSLN